MRRVPDALHPRRCDAEREHAPGGRHMNRRDFLTMPVALALKDTARPAYQATGVKVGEVSDNSAIVWMRLTARPSRRAGGGPRPGPAGPVSPPLPVQGP